MSPQRVPPAVARRNFDPRPLAGAYGSPPAPRHRAADRFAGEIIGRWAFEKA
jgi:hypothetical protein